MANFDSVTDLRAVGRMVQTALDTYGALHAVSNPAGILRDRMAHNMTEDEWDMIMTVHLRGHFNVVRATINHFRTQQDGVYVMWSSSSGLIGNVGQTNYGAAKMGIAAFSRIIAMEGARNNVRSNAVAPGAATRMTDSVPRDEEGAKRREAMREVQSPVRPAQLTVALMSDAAKSISGQIFGAGGYNLSVYSQPRPVHTYSREGGWDADGIVADFFPLAEKDFTPLGRTVPRRWRFEVAGARSKASRPRLPTTISTPPASASGARASGFSMRTRARMTLASSRQSRASSSAKVSTSLKWPVRARAWALAATVA